MHFAAPISVIGNEGTTTIASTESKKGELSNNTLISLPKLADEHLWISTERQCKWHSIACDDGSVIAMDLRNSSISGKIPTEVGLLKNMVAFDFGK